MQFKHFYLIFAVLAFQFMGAALAKADWRCPSYCHLGRECTTELDNQICDDACVYFELASGYCASKECWCSDRE